MVFAELKRTDVEHMWYQICVVYTTHSTHHIATCATSTLKFHADVPPYGRHAASRWGAAYRFKVRRGAGSNSFKISGGFDRYPTCSGGNGWNWHQTPKSVSCVHSISDFGRGHGTALEADTVICWAMETETHWERGRDFWTKRQKWQWVCTLVRFCWISF